jgi:hypothetical protein
MVFRVWMEPALVQESPASPHDGETADHTNNIEREAAFSGVFRPEEAFS